MAKYTGVGKNGYGSGIKVKEVIEFHRTKNNSLRAEICDIGGLPYVGLSRFWLPDGQTEFVATRKSIFLRKEQWEKLVMSSDDISKGLYALSNSLSNAGIFISV